MGLLDLYLYSFLLGAESTIVGVCVFFNDTAANPFVYLRYCELNIQIKGHADVF
jgi:hypothetical protein